MIRALPLGLPLNLWKNAYSPPHTPTGPSAGSAVVGVVGWMPWGAPPDISPGPVIREGPRSLWVVFPLAGAKGLHWLLSFAPRTQRSHPSPPALSWSPVPPHLPCPVSYLSRVLLEALLVKGKPVPVHSGTTFFPSPAFSVTHSHCLQSAGRREELVPLRVGRTSPPRLSLLRKVVDPITGC